VTIGPETSELSGEKKSKKKKERNINAMQSVTCSLSIIISVSCCADVVVSALSLGMGVILYISAVNDEVAHRKKSPSGGSSNGDNGSVQEFSYRYGWAFFFGGATFVCAMAAAVSNISLYLQRYSHFDDMLLIVPQTGSGGGGGTTVGAESSSDSASIYRPMRWTNTFDDSRCVGSSTAPNPMPRWSDVKGRKLSTERADRRLYESNHSISIPL